MADKVRVSGRGELIARLLRLEERASILRNAREKKLRAAPALGLDPDARDEVMDRRVEEVMREIAVLRARYEDEKGERLQLPAVLSGDPLSLLERLSAARPDVLFMEMYVAGGRTCAALARQGRVEVKVVGPGQAELTANVLARPTTHIGNYTPVTGLIQNLADLAREPSLAHFLALDAEIERVSDYLTRLLGPVLSEWTGDGCRRLALMPHGPLASIPLHALIWIDGAPLLDRVDVTYAPNVFALPLQMEAPAPPGERLVVSGTDDLPFARLEARVFTRLTGAESLGGDPELVLLRSHQASWLHFAAHGSVDHLLPLDSGVTLPGGRLTVDDVLYRMSLASGATVSLTTCEGSAPAFDPNDDQLGLASAFLVAGAGTVLAPVWPVDDLVALLMTLQFLSCLDGASDLSEAWNQAQRLVRDITVDEFEREWVPRLHRYIPSLKPEVLAVYTANARNGHPFGWPVQWGAFHCTGGWHLPADRLTLTGASDA
jgi:CHAT domain-containing protein